jgi:hypothetical protein
VANREGGAPSFHSTAISLGSCIQQAATCNQ